MKTETKTEILLIAIIIAILIIFAYAAILMWLWNIVVVPIFSLSSLTYWQAFGLIIISNILFKKTSVSPNKE